MTNYWVQLFLQNKEFIELLAAVGTFISAIIAIYTLNEVKKQRLSTYKPELFLESFCVKPSFNPLLNDELLNYKMTPYNDYSDEKKDPKDEIFVMYKLENLGFGVAKDIECKWKFDYKKAISEINKIIDKDFELEFSHDSYCLRKKTDENFYRFSDTNFDKREINFISPINVKEHNNKHSMPKIIIFTYYYYLIFKYKFLNEDAKLFYIEEFEKLPKPELTVVYKDLNGKKYSKVITFKICALCTQFEEVIDTTKEFCIFHFVVE